MARTAETPLASDALRDPAALSPLAVVPSWLISLAFHAVLLFVLATNLQSCGTPSLDGEGGDFRQVGIYVKPAESDQPSDALEENANAADAAIASPSSSSAPTSEVDDRPPVPLSMPVEAAPVIGGGAPTPSVVPNDLSQFAQNNGIRSPAAAAAGGVGQGEVPFFGIRDKGTRFVYVLDCSGSMAGSPILIAKSELMASLQSLERTQQFQIIFYNQAPREMVLQGDRAQLYWGTDINKTLARQFISGVQPDLGTDHLPALKRALRLGPEVIFFLTDADEPSLRAPDLAEIRQLNQGRTRIHCVEFGKGAELNTDNFLKRLARDNGGTYRYRDVTRFRR